MGSTKSGSNGSRRRSRSAGITADSHVTLSVKQVLIAIAAVAGIGSGYAYLVWNQTGTGKDVSELKATVASVATKTDSASKEQDAKREQMGKDFLASQQKLVDRVADLHDAVVQQKATQDAMASTLTTIANELHQAFTPPPKVPTR